MRALALGLELCRHGSAWSFVGSWQDPACSGVPFAVMAALLSNGYVCIGIGERAELTDVGARALERRLDSEIRILRCGIKLSGTGPRSKKFPTTI